MDDDARFESLRRTEYDYLDAGGHAYLDYTGSGLVSRSQLNAHHDRLSNGLFGNPHSENPPSVASTRLVEQARRAVLAHLHADPDEYKVIFTPNATGACRLVGEAYPFGPGTGLVLTTDNHNSVNGLRELARNRGAGTYYVPMSAADLRTDDDALVETLAVAGRTGIRARFARPRQVFAPGTHRRGLLAFPAQSNLSGVQLPLGWIDLAHNHGYDVLLDAAAYLPTNPLRLDRVHPDFVAISWYKVFGYPTGVGCLVARRNALARLQRPWFSGGTIVAVSVAADWHWPADDETAYEDGTVNFLSIPDVEVGLSWIAAVGIESIQARVRSLTRLMLARLTGLRHPNGAPLVHMYGPLDDRDRGGTIALNLLDPDGVMVDERLVATEAAAAGISLRTGCFCNPGAAETALGLTAARLRGSSRWGAKTVDDYLDLLGLDVGGAVRVSIGIASNADDIDRLIGFFEEAYAGRSATKDGLAPRLRC
jgi:selenocysteine lyase/cysteine desulfurase